MLVERFHFTTSHQRSHINNLLFVNIFSKLSLLARTVTFTKHRSVVDIQSLVCVVCLIGGHPTSQKLFLQQRLSDTVTRFNVLCVYPICSSNFEPTRHHLSTNMDTSKSHRVLLYNVYVISNFLIETAAKQSIEHSYLQPKRNYQQNQGN